MDETHGWQRWWTGGLRRRPPPVMGVRIELLAKADWCGILRLSHTAAPVGTLHL